MLFPIYDVHIPWILTLSRILSFKKLDKTANDARNQIGAEIMKTFFNRAG